MCRLRGSLKARTKSGIWCAASFHKQLSICSETLNSTGDTSSLNGLGIGC